MPRVVTYPLLADRRAAAAAAVAQASDRADEAGRDITLTLAGPPRKGGEHELHLHDGLDVVTDPEVGAAVGAFQPRRVESWLAWPGMSPGDKSRLVDLIHRRVRRVAP